MVLLACIALAAATCGESPDAEGEHGETETTRALMDQIFGALRVTLPASVEPEVFGAPDNRERMAAELGRLASGAEGLEHHIEGRDGQARFLARSIARDAREVQRAYVGGQYRRAAFLVQQITENCIVCHTRLPYPKDAPVAKGFVEGGVFATLPPEPRANLQMATRRFDDALLSLEELFRSPEHAALMVGPLTDYLVICVRVKQDYERPVPVLRRFAQREDVWTELRRDVLRWADVLPVLGKRAQAHPDLATARQILAEGNALSPIPRAHAALAHWVVASGILERLIHSDARDDPDLAETYYLMGLVEARIGRHAWVTPAPFLLESAIRLAPGSAFAEDAYASLETELLSAWEGSSVQALPPEEEQRLRALRALIDAAHREPAPTPRG